MTHQSSAEELELAIKDQQQWCHCKGIVCHGCESIVGKMFKAGAEWQSARDKKTIDGLKKLGTVIGKVIEKVEEHREAYGLDIFPNSEKLDSTSSVDNISAKMVRHMCDCFLRYIQEALKENE